MDYIKGIREAGESVTSGAIITTVGSDSEHFKGYAESGYVFLESTPSSACYAKIMTSGVVSVKCVGTVNKGDIVYSIASGDNAGKVSTIKTNNQLGIALSDSNADLVVISIAPAYVAGGGGSVSWNDITDKPSTFAPSAHDHDGRYYTESEADTLLASKAAVSDIPAKVSDLVNDSGFITDAPSDNNEYVRKNGAWSVSSGGGGGGTTKIQNIPYNPTLWSDFANYDIVPEYKVVASNVNPNTSTYDGTFAGVATINLAAGITSSTCPVGTDLYIDGSLRYAHYACPYTNLHTSGFDDMQLPIKIGHTVTEPLILTSGVKVGVYLDWEEFDRAIYAPTSTPTVTSQSTIPNSGRHRPDYPAILIECADSSITTSYVGKYDYSKKVFYVSADASVKRPKGWKQENGTVYEMRSGIVSVTCGNTSCTAGSPVYGMIENPYEMVYTTQQGAMKRVGYALSTYSDIGLGCRIWVLIDFE